MLDLTGDRDIEWSFVAANIPPALRPGLEALDFGCRDTSLGLIAAMRGYHTLSIDLEEQVFTWYHPNRRFRKLDLLDADFKGKQFDLIINCSTIEHVGLPGRYGVTEGHPNGDVYAMTKLYELMKPGAVQILTLPVGLDAVFAPLHRVYGQKRLDALLDGLAIEHQEFWRKDETLGWNPTDSETAINYPSAWDDQRRIYAIGCFVLRKAA